MTRKDAIRTFDVRTIDVKIFGTVSISADGQPVVLTPKTQLLAASLFLAAGHRVPAGRLRDQIWDGEKAGETRQALYDLVRDLRRELDAACPGASAIVVQQSGTYAAQIDAGQVDVNRFQSLLEEARDLDQQHHDTHSAAARYRQALDEWGVDLTGPDEPLAGLAGRWAMSVRYRLQSAYLTGLLNFIDAQLRLRQHAQAVPVLTQLATLHPHNERAAELYMQALCRSGQPTEAEAVYRQLHARLRSDTGREPGERLQQLHQRILCGEEGLDTPMSEDESVSTPKPQQAAPADAPAAEEAPKPITPPAQHGPPLFGHVESVEKFTVFKAPVHIERGGFTIN